LAAPKDDRPKLKPGERWNADKGVVEAVPGSDLYIRQSTKHGDALRAVNSIDVKTDNAIKKIAEVLDPKNKSAFESNFGGYNAYATQFIPGETQNIRATLDSLKSDMKSAGLELMRQGGSIGQMTLAEWPIVERAIENITPLLGEAKAREALEGVAAHLDRIRKNAKEVYETEWRNTQFGDKSDKTMDKMPPANQHRGRVIEDDSGRRFKSDGMSWKPL